jgi:hypothetical protein
MELPKYIADIIKPAPEGYMWVYHGRAWRSPNALYVIYRNGEICGYHDATNTKRFQSANGFPEYEYIELVKVHDIPTTFEGQLEYAKSLVGKRVSNKTDKGVYRDYNCYWEVKNFEVLLSNYDGYRNSSVQKSLEKGWSVVVWMTSDDSYLPVELATIVEIPTPTSKTIKLTDDYDVVIYKDKIEVGCQTIPKEKICEILLEMEKL